MSRNKIHISIASRICVNLLIDLWKNNNNRSNSFRTNQVIIKYWNLSKNGLLVKIFDYWVVERNQPSWFMKTSPKTTQFVPRKIGLSSELNLNYGKMFSRFAGLKNRIFFFFFFFFFFISPRPAQCRTNHGGGGEKQNWSHSIHSQNSPFVEGWLVTTFLLLVSLFVFSLSLLPSSGSLLLMKGLSSSGISGLHLPQQQLQQQQQQQQHQHPVTIEQKMKMA